MDRFDWLELDAARGAPAAQGDPARAGTREPPHDGPSYYREARRMRYAGHFRAAANFYERALGFNAQHFAAWTELVDTLVRARRVAAAHAKLQEAMANFRQVRDLYASQALVSLHQGRIADAWPHSNISLETETPSWYACCVRAELHLSVNRKDLAPVIEMLDRAVDVARNPWEAHFLGGWLWLDAGLPLLAASYLAEAGHLNPRAPLCWLCLGDAFKALRFYDQAMFYYQCATELESHNELALDRQRACASLVYGLMRAIPRRRLRTRWRRAWERLLKQYRGQFPSNNQEW